MDKKKIVIAIDGPAGAGKSTLAKALAEELNYTYLDTGAMYRAITLKALEENIDVCKEEEVAKLTETTTVNIENGQVFLDGIDVTAKIREKIVEESVSIVSRYKAIREYLVNQQRIIAKNKAIVVDGRDIGSYVLPEAELKIYLAATLPIRAKRRFLQQTNKNISLEEVMKDIARRDEIDSKREIGPLKLTLDARYLDSSNLTLKEVVKEISSMARTVINDEKN